MSTTNARSYDRTESQHVDVNGDAGALEHELMSGNSNRVRKKPDANVTIANIASAIKDTMVNIIIDGLNAVTHQRFRGRVMVRSFGAKISNRKFPQPCPSPV
jgi:hypothetical protein